MSREAYVQPIRGYRILERIGSGAMGSVYRARQASLDRAVALKVIRREQVAGRATLERLKKEARILARLDHPNIVRVFDMGEDGAYVYLAMELVDGQSLKDLMAEHGPLSEGVVLTIAEKVASALDHASRRQVVHRDVKPGNILVGRGGGVKLSDFGLALTTLEHSLTRTGLAVGTPQYIAPEQAGNSRKVDVRSDIYSLGATLYHALTGQFPFRGDSVADVITSVLFETPRSPDSLVDDLHPATSRIIGKMMAKRPSRRYPTPAALLADLERLKVLREAPGGDASELGIDWSEVGLCERPWFRRPELIVPGAGLVIGLIVVVAMLLHRPDDGESARATEVESRTPSAARLRQLWVDQELPESEILRLIDAALLGERDDGGWARLRRDIVAVLVDRAGARIERVVREARAELLDGEVTRARAHLDHGLQPETLVGSAIESPELRGEVARRAATARESYGLLEQGLLASLQDRVAEFLADLEAAHQTRLLRGEFRSAAAALRDADYGVFELEALETGPGGESEVVTVHLARVDRLPAEEVARLQERLRTAKRRLHGQLVARLAGRRAELEAALIGARRQAVERIHRVGLEGQSAEDLAAGLITETLEDLAQSADELQVEEDLGDGGGQNVVASGPQHWLVPGKTLAEMRVELVGALRSAARDYEIEAQTLAEGQLRTRLEALARDRDYERAKAILEQAPILSDEFRDGWAERIELLLRVRAACLAALSDRVGQVVDLRTRSGILIHKRLEQLDRSSATIRLEGLGDPIALADIAADSLLETIGDDEDVPARARAWFLVYEGSLDRAQELAAAVSEAKPREAVVREIARMREAGRQEMAAARERLESLLARADQLEASGDLVAARQCLEEWLDDDWLRRIPELRARIQEVKKRQAALGAAADRGDLHELLRKRYSGITTIDQTGRIEAVYRFRDARELQDFRVDTARFVVTERGLLGRRPLGDRSSDFYRNLPGPRLAVLFDRSLPFTVELDYTALVDHAEPEFLGLRVQGLCLGIKSFHQEGLTGQINAWVGELDDFEPYFYDPTLGESRPRERGLGTRPISGFSRGARFTLSLEYDPSEGIVLWIEGLEKVRVYTIRKFELPEPSGIEFRTAVPSLFEGLRFRGTIDEKWIRSR